MLCFACLKSTTHCYWHFVVSVPAAAFGGRRGPKGRAWCQGTAPDNAQSPVSASISSHHLSDLSRTVSHSQSQPVTAQSAGQPVSAIPDRRNERRRRSSGRAGSRIPPSGSSMLTSDRVQTTACLGTAKALCRPLTAATHALAVRSADKGPGSRPRGIG